ncbi:hypothetical protein CP973_02230 [Streptomyces albofaciens JCM 4342]|uniref:hypothetical protein n=1 Tax=Streptomyces albofaciens TaxID=66866 RepID=UPI00123BECBB|nr:hypothetical protein [Streptomyces albofaciens]KAA6220956.1 hypothetical protein CP973_02230 [Streptomyces albofaciens JCM 4342]
MAWRSVAVTAAWVCVVAGAGALGAWSLASADTGGRNDRAVPLDDGAVRDKLAAARAAAPTSEPSSGTPSGSPSGAPSGASGKPSGPAATGPSSGSPSPGSPARPVAGGTVRLAGGSATAECRADGRIYLTVWSPATGYRADDVRRGPAATAAIEFEPLDDHAGNDHAYTLRCAADGRPQAAPAPEDDDDD